MRPLDGRQRILVKVKPQAPRTEILDYDEARDIYTVAVKAPPKEGKANEALEKFLSKEAGVTLSVVSGAAGRLKLLRSR